MFLRHFLFIDNFLDLKKKCQNLLFFYLKSWEKRKGTVQFMSDASDETKVKFAISTGTLFG